MKIYENRDGEYGHLLTQELHLPPELASPEAVAAYEALGKRYLHFSGRENTPGLNMFISAWYFEENREKLLKGRDISEFECHVHDTDEILIYYGSDPDDPNELGGEVEFIIGGESHVINKSTVLYVPAGVPHSKPLVNRIERPIFHLAMELAR